MKKLFKIIGLVSIVAIVGVMVLGTAAFAQKPAEDAPANGFYGRGPHGPMGGGLLHSDETQTATHEALAKALGLSVADFEAAVAEGQRLYEIAEAQGVDFTEVRAAMAEARQAAWEAAGFESVPGFEGRVGRGGMRGGGRSGRLAGPGGLGLQDGSCLTTQ